MASASAAPYCRLYDSARQAIQQQQQGSQEENTSTTTGRRQEHQHQQDCLENKLDRMIKEAHQSSSNSSGNNRLAPSGGTKRQRRDEQEKKTPADDKRQTIQQAGDIDCDDETSVQGGGEGGLEEKCLGLFAEAFADDLDLLRKEEHFRGSAKNIAAMADMMR